MAAGYQIFEKFENEKYVHYDNIKHGRLYL